MLFRLCLFFLIFSFQSCAYYFGNARVKKSTAIGFVPKFSKNYEFFQKQDPAKHPIVHDWAEKKLNRDWEINGKVNIPRIVLAKLALNQDLQEINEYLCSLQPWGKSGTDWFLNPKGDYDFTEIILVNILYLNAEKLSQKTQHHLVDILLTEQRPKPFVKAPNTFCLLKETENHILMKESVRYLRRAWMLKMSDNDTKLKKESEFLEKWLIKYLNELSDYGLWEYNSIPYLGYTVIPLLTLHAHAPSAEIRRIANAILDYINYEYALGSLKFKRVVPFRRQLRRFGWNELSSDPHTSLMKSWYYDYKKIPVSKELSSKNTHQSLLALLLDYRLPDEIVKILEGEYDEYFCTIGHGWKSSPEFHWKGKNAMISGGGLQRGKLSQLVPRPIVLIMNDSASTIEDCIHIKGLKNISKINNTGVYKRFAVGRGPVFVPSAIQAEVANGNWKIIRAGKTQDYICIYSADDLGIISYFPDSKKDAPELLKIIAENNKNTELLFEKFFFPDQTCIEYELKSPKNKWVIKAINGKLLKRKHDHWNGIEFYR